MVIITITISFTFDKSRNISWNGSANGNITDTTKDIKLSKDCNERVQYTGSKSHIFTFTYPKCYQINKNDEIDLTGRAVRLNDEDYPKFQDHIVFSYFDSSYKGERDCTIDQFDTGYLYKKSINLAGIDGCEESLQKTLDGVEYTLLMYNLYDYKDSNRTWTIVAWAREKNDLEIFRKMAESLEIK